MVSNLSVFWGWLTKKLKNCWTFLKPPLKALSSLYRNCSNYWWQEGLKDTFYQTVTMCHSKMSINLPKVFGKLPLERSPNNVWKANKALYFCCNINRDLHIIWDKWFKNFIGYFCDHWFCFKAGQMFFRCQMSLAGGINWRCTDTFCNNCRILQ